MVFFDSSTGLWIVQDTLFRTNENVNNYPLKDITRYVNEWYSRVAFAILQADGRMSWDDTNHTDQPISVTNIVANQPYYEIFSATPSALQDWLMIDRIEIKDASGEWKLLRPIDKHDTDQALGEFQDVPATPDVFDFNGSELYLYPAANYNSTGGMKIYFNRAPSYFASTDTTKRPGFATIFHSYLPIYASNQWNIIKKNDFSLQPLLDKMEMEIGKFYSKRNKVETPRLERAYDTFK